MINQPADYVRLLNIVLAVVYLVWTTVTWRIVLSIPRSGLMRQMALSAMVAASAWASWETVRADSPAPGFRSFLYTLALVWALYAHHLLVHDKRRARERDHH